LKIPQASSPSVLISAMRQELDRSFDKLKNSRSAPLYFLSYRVTDTQGVRLKSSYGALTEDSVNRQRILNVEARVGNMQTDSSHKLRSYFGGDMGGFFYSGFEQIPLDDDQSAIRTTLWLATDAAYKSAQRKYLEVRADKEVLASETDPSPDFSSVTPVVSIEMPEKPNVPVEQWKKRLNSLSTIYKEYPDITESYVELNFDLNTRYITTSEGTQIQANDTQARVFTSVNVICDDGMMLTLYDTVDALALNDLPDDKVLETRVRKLADSIVALKHATVAEPYVGPAILRNTAAGVFFHEILGHRVEGHRQKDEEEGRTFAKKINERIMPKFISVYDDPTLPSLGDKVLAGHYKFDDEGVPAQRVTVVKHGVLENFLMGRSPINNFRTSNGHSRSSPGIEPVARQGNFIVESSKEVPFGKLKEMLVQEAKRQGKPYGLIFEELAGGFTITQAFMPQAFQLLPLKVTRVWTDGRPDELLRGVNLVGTPLASLETIMCAANDSDTFNGVCGAESGWVPVAARSPSLLVRTIETAKEWKEQDKPPILPPPLFDGQHQLKKAELH
jgi:predicted Zn-dependent protease